MDKQIPPLDIQACQKVVHSYKYIHIKIVGIDFKLSSQSNIKLHDCQQPQLPDKPRPELFWFPTTRLAS